MKTRFGKLFLLALLAIETTASAAKYSESVSTVSDRMSHRAGAYLGILGDPFPTILGVNLAYNVVDFMRATAGFGRVSSGGSSATTLGVGTRFMVPGWSLTPVAGLSLAYVSVSSGSGFVSVQNFSSSGAHVYGTIGVDWQTSSGFNLGVGYNVSFKSGIGGVPYINVGWYFDFA